MIFVKNMNSVSDQDWTTSEKYPGVRWKFLIDEFNKPNIDVEKSKTTPPVKNKSKIKKISKK